MAIARSGPIPFDLPQPANVNLLMQPLMQGMQTYRQGMQQQFEGERALERERLAKKADARADEDQAAQREQRLVQRMGALAQVVRDDPNEASASANWGKLVQSMPQLRDRLAQYGIDPNNHRAGANFVAAEAGKYVSPLEKQKAELGIQAQRGQIAVTQAQLAQLKSQTPEYRASVAEQYGMQRGTPAYNAFVISGQYSPDTTKFQVIPEGASVLSENPRTGQAQVIHQGTPKVDSTAKRAIFEAQDELPNLRATVDNLKEAQGLIDSIYTGIGSGVRSAWNQAAPNMLPNVLTNPNRAKDTQRYNQIMGAEAIGTMSQTLKGATTNEEMKAFVNLINDPNVGPDVKKKAIAGMIRRAEAHYQNRVDRIKELGGRMPNDGAGLSGGQGVSDPLGIR